MSIALSTEKAARLVDLPERWVVVGAGGMLGRDLVDVLHGVHVDVVPITRAELDVTDAEAAERVIQGADADVVVNCAAWTAVDDAEAREGDAFAVNAVGAANVARAARSARARVVHISTDYVFDGAAAEPYTEDAPLAPRSAYGRTKAAGEWAVRAEAPDHLILRTAWLYGAHGACFPKTMARLAAERDLLTVVDDQIGQPTWTRDVAELIVRLVAASAPSGTYHATASGSTSWYGFARRVIEGDGFDTAVEPTTTSAFPRPAPRPAYSVLAHGALEAVGVAPIDDWATRWDTAAKEVLA